LGAAHSRKRGTLRLNKKATAMAKSRGLAKQSRKTRNDALFVRASQYSDRGELRSAFRLFLAAAKAGDKSCQLNVGYCYDTGTGVRQNVPAALYWYRRLYRRGDRAAATSIGTVWRDRQKPKRALYWFRRAVQMGDEGANLEIAKLFLANGKDHRKAIPYLERVCRSEQEAEATIEEAQRLLKLTQRALSRSQKNSKFAG
jgi:TPR repeat protein